MDAGAFEVLSQLLQYVRGDYADPQTYVTLRAALGNAKHPLYYLAVPPESFSVVANGIAATGCGSGGLLLGRPRSASRPLSLDPPVLFARPSIDVLLESAADSYGAGALAVVLTGSNEDGAYGAAAVKRAGGRVVVQDPRTARAPAGPLAVMGRTVVDAVVPIEEMAALLAGLCAAPAPLTD